MSILFFVANMFAITNLVPAAEDAEDSAKPFACYTKIESKRLTKQTNISYIIYRKLSLGPNVLVIIYSLLPI